MKKKDFKKNILENIEEINVLDNLKDYANNTTYQTDAKVKPFGKMKFVLASLSVVLVLVFVIIGLNNSGSEVFDEKPNSEAVEENDPSFKPNTNLDSFIEYYNEELSGNLTIEDLMKIFDSFCSGLNDEEVINELNLNDEEENVKELFKYYKENLK